MIIARNEKQTKTTWGYLMYNTVHTVATFHLAQTSYHLLLIKSTYNHAFN